MSEKRPLCFFLLLKHRISLKDILIYVLSYKCCFSLFSRTFNPSWAKMNFTQSLLSEESQTQSKAAAGQTYARRYERYFIGTRLARVVVYFNYCRQFCPAMPDQISKFTYKKITGYPYLNLCCVQFLPYFATYILVEIACRLEILSGKPGIEYLLAGYSPLASKMGFCFFSLPLFNPPRVKKSWKFWHEETPFLSQGFLKIKCYQLLIIIYRRLAKQASSQGSKLLHGCAGLAVHAIPTRPDRPFHKFQSFKTTTNCIDQ